MQTGQLVTFSTRSGKYVGEITACHPDRYLVKTIAVIKHPNQGDLHHPKEIDVPFFHERKALALGEQTYIPLKMAKPFDGEAPNYNNSLKDSFNKLYNELKTTETPFSVKSIECLENIAKEYEALYAIKLHL